MPQGGQNSKDNTESQDVRKGKLPCQVRRRSPAGPRHQFQQAKAVAETQARKRPQSPKTGTVDRTQPYRAKSWIVQSRKTSAAVGGAPRTSVNAPKEEKRGGRQHYLSQM